MMAYKIEFKENGMVYSLKKGKDKLFSYRLGSGKGVPLYLYILFRKVLLEEKHASLSNISFPIPKDAGESLALISLILDKSPTLESQNQILKDLNAWKMIGHKQWSDLRDKLNLFIIMRKLETKIED